MFVTIIFIKYLYKKFIIFKIQRVTGEEFLDEFGWKQVSGDVFRKPKNPMFLSCFLGTGIQVI